MEGFDMIVPERLASWARIESGDTAPGATCWGKAIRIKFPIDAKKLEKSIQKLIDDFDIYRTVFKEIDGNFYAKTLTSLDFKLTVITPKGKTKEDKMKFVIEDCQKRIDSKFSIDESCSQFVLYKLGLMDNVIFIAMTHLITDGYSLSLTFYNVLSYYMQNKPMYDMNDQGSFKDYMAEEIEYLNSSTWEKDIPYWEEVLSGYVPKKVNPHGILKYEKEKSGDYIDVSKKNIPQVAQKYKTSVFNLLLTAFHLAICSLNGTSDSLIKYADSNRSRKYKYTLGFLALLIPNRARIDRNMHISELISNLSAQSQKDYIHRKAGSYFYGNTDYILSYLPNRVEARYDKSSFENTASAIDLQLLDFKCGRDMGSIFAIVVNDMPDKFIMEFIGSSKIYGMDYMDKFKQEYIRIIQQIGSGEDMLISDLLELEDEIEEI